MKKPITILAAAGLAASVSAQGFVNMANSSTTEVSTNPLENYLGFSEYNLGAAIGPTFGSGTAPQGYYFALFAQLYSGGGTAAVNIFNLTGGGWQFTGLYATNALGAGRFSPGTVDAATAQDMAIGSEDQYLVLGWSSNESHGANVNTILAALGTEDWLVPYGGYVGVSSVGVVLSVAGGPPATASTLFGTAPGITSGFQLDFIDVDGPEPSSLALSAVGGASLLLFRLRRKK
jgi:hypothetical protein